jgi:hypothetical protein
MWRRAHGLFSEHLEGSESSCTRCGDVYPCRAVRLAWTGMLTAVGQVNDDSVYWTEYARLLALLPGTDLPRAHGGRS